MKGLKQRTRSLLRHSEKYFQTDMVYFASGGFWLSAGQVFSATATFLLAVAFANFIQQETYGTYKYVLSITGILAVLTLKGMDVAVLQSITRNLEGVLIPALKEKIKWGILASFASVCVAVYYFISGNNTIAACFLIASFFLPFIESFVLYHSLLNGRRLFHISVIYKTLTQIVGAISLIVCLFFTKNLLTIIFVYFASVTLLNLFFFVTTTRKYPPNAATDPDVIPYGKHMSIVNVLDAFTTSVDGLLIFHYLGSVNLALYFFALAPISQLRTLVGNIPTLIVPKLSNKSTKEIGLILRAKMPLLFIIGIFISFVYILVTPHIYALFFPKYLDAVFSSQLFSISIILILPQTILGSALTAKLTLIPKEMLYLFNIPGIVFILFVITLIGNFGINGVILSRLLALISGYVISYLMWRKIKTAEQYQQSKSIGLFPG